MEETYSRSKQPIYQPYLSQNNGNENNKRLIQNESLRYYGVYDFFCLVVIRHMTRKA